jgi:hypothetical protein
MGLILEDVFIQQLSLPIIKTFAMAVYWLSPLRIYFAASDGWRFLTERMKMLIDLRSIFPLI